MRDPTRLLASAITAAGEEYAAVRRGVVAAALHLGRRDGAALGEIAAHAAGGRAMARTVDGYAPPLAGRDDRPERFDSLAVAFGRREIYGADAMLYAARAVVAYAVALLDGAPRTVAAERFGAVLSDGAAAWIHAAPAVAGDAVRGFAFTRPAAPTAAEVSTARGAARAVRDDAAKAAVRDARIARRAARRAAQ